jgi:hypothetical protein
MLGMALSTKNTAIVFVIPLLAFFAIQSFFKPLRTCFHLAVIIVTSWLLLCATYCFSHMFIDLGEFSFVSGTLSGVNQQDFDPRVEFSSGNRFRGTILEKLPVPMPADWLIGIDLQKYDFELGMRSYLDGEWKRGGWYHYYLFAMFYKMTIPSLLLMFAGGLLSIRNIVKTRSLNDLCLLVPAFILFVFVSANTGFNHHMRYVLPVFPLLLLTTVHVANAARTRRWLQCVLVGLLGWHVSATIQIAPHFMSYFNPIAGGPENGWKHLVDSNIDWGQDTGRFRKWLDAHPERRPLGARLYSMSAKYEIGNRVGEVPQEPTPGWYAISVNYVAGSSFRIDRDLVGPYVYFQKLIPVDRIGYSIHIYHITLEEANRVRAEMGLPLLPEPAPEGLPPGEPPPKGPP